MNRCPPPPPPPPPWSIHPRPIGPLSESRWTDSVLRWIVTFTAGRSHQFTPPAPMNTARMHPDAYRQRVRCGSRTYSTLFDGFTRPQSWAVMTATRVAIRTVRISMWCGRSRTCPCGVWSHAPRCPRSPLQCRCRWPTSWPSGSSTRRGRHALLSATGKKCCGRRPSL